MLNYFDRNIFKLHINRYKLLSCAIPNDKKMDKEFALSRGKFLSQITISKKQNDVGKGNQKSLTNIIYSNKLYITKNSVFFFSVSKKKVQLAIRSFVSTKIFLLKNAHLVEEMLKLSKLIEIMIAIYD